MLPSKKLLSLRSNFCKHLISSATYSRKSDSKNEGYYKIVESNDVTKEIVDSRFGSIPNWELLAPKGYRFLLPGSVGPAWHETGSMVPLDTFQRTDSKQNKINFDILQCTAQECPVLLKKGTKMKNPNATCNINITGVLELFPNNKMYTSQNLTVVTLTHKKKYHQSRLVEPDSEYEVKTFVWAAQEICIKLKSSGYWADFINPFSGRPYLSPYYKSSLYKTDERFRCLGFEIRKSGSCKVIQSKSDQQFIGSLFTNAPANTKFLYDILTEN